VKSDVKVPDADLARLQTKILQKHNGVTCGIAYLLGKGKVKQSLVPITSKPMVEGFYSRIDDINGKDDVRAMPNFNCCET